MAGKGSHQTKSATGAVDEMDAAPASDVYQEPWRALAGWFLGPRAENRDDFNRLVQTTLNWYEDCRESYHPCDPCYITQETKASKAYRAEIQDLEGQLKWMHDKLSASVPFFSPRYKGHMCWEVTMPSFLGYLSGMLWNQNNVDSSASPVTTAFELSVGNHLCQLMNFDGSSLTGRTVQSWGHITGCGSVSNIEALWVARNLKFHPLAVRAAVMDPKATAVHGGQNYPIYIPSLDKEIPLKDCTQWQLLNLDVDFVCDMSQGVADKAGVTLAVLDTYIQKHSLVSVGLANFFVEHKIEKAPIFFSPGTNHYSWPKGATVLGIGDKNVIPVQVDAQCRQDMGDLERHLQRCCDQKIPVLCVVCVVGSTEESSVDPVSKVVALRNKFRRKGLSFLVHADAAWGGYLLSMIREPTKQRHETFRRRDEDFVPSMALSEYVQEQYRAIKDTDTVTIDPHKAGYCLYPAGALCYRNGSLRGFITLKAPEVFHGGDDPSVGVYGLEGSKPGAAAAGVLMSHRVIGLDQQGYGRILGQCTFGTKLFYCMWMTVALEDDDFVCVNFIDLPPQYDLTEMKKLIRERILGRDTQQIYQDKEAMRVLQDVGPDALINTFGVNMKNNSSVEVANELQSLIFSELSGRPGESAKRVSMFLTTSSFEAERYGKSLEQFKQRLGLPVDEKSLNFLRNTVMNPFQTGSEVVLHLGKLFRNTVLNCVGKLSSGHGDELVQHSFVVCGRMTKSGKVFVDHQVEFGVQGKMYHVIATMIIDNEKERDEFRQLQKANRLEPIFFRFWKQMKIFDLLRNEGRQKGLVVDVFVGSIPGPDREGARLHCHVRVDEVFRYNHIEKPTVPAVYPAFQTYYLFGDERAAYMSHIVDYYPNFHQVVQLDSLPHSIPVELLDLGLEVTVSGIDGRPLVIENQIVDPLQGEAFKIHYRGKQYADCKTTVHLSKKGAKIWFEGSKINAL